MDNEEIKRYREMAPYLADANGVVKECLDEIEKLRKALRFYAQPQIYYYSVDGGDATLLNDRGDTAREALNEREEPLKKFRE